MSQEILNIRLTRDEYSALCVLIGYARGAMQNDGEHFGAPEKRATDAFIVEGGGEPYWHSKEEIQTRLEAPPKGTVTL